ncbi:hypothetical protein QE368_001324 [Asaia bogorensis NBRC 16594]|nr:hypothetical protein [Asaia bogorensis NBRC 16594]
MMKNELAVRRQGRIMGLLGGLSLVMISLFALTYLRL